MQRLVVDTSVLIDLRKACSLSLLTKSTYDLITTNIAFGELKHFTHDQINELIRGGLRVIPLSLKFLNRLNYFLEENQWMVSPVDASLYLLAKSYSGSILLTGDGELRKLAQSNGLEVHGTIWLFQQFFRSEISTPTKLCSALQKLRNDKTVRLPDHEMSVLIEEISGKS